MNDQHLFVCLSTPEDLCGEASTPVSRGPVMYKPAVCERNTNGGAPLALSSSFLVIKVVFNDRRQEQSCVRATWHLSHEAKGEKLRSGARIAGEFGVVLESAFLGIFVRVHVRGRLYCFRLDKTNKQRKQNKKREEQETFAVR